MSLTLASTIGSSFAILFLGILALFHDRRSFTNITLGDNISFELSVKIKNTIINPFIKLTDSIRTIQNQDINSNNSSNVNGKKK